MRATDGLVKMLANVLQIINLVLSPAICFYCVSYTSYHPRILMGGADKFPDRQPFSSVPGHSLFPNFPPRLQTALPALWLVQKASFFVLLQVWRRNC